MRKLCLVFSCIPTDNHIRSLLDAVEPVAVYPLFDFVFDGFQRSGEIDSFRTADNRLLLALDGRQILPASSKVTFAQTFVR